MEDYKKIAIELGQTLISKAPETREDVERMLPELKESDDEKIRKHLVYHFQNKTKEEWNGMPVKDILDWLEKQGEHADFRNKIQIGDKVTRNEDGVLVNLSQLNRVAKKDEKQGEQKQEWSEEDEQRLEDVIREIRARRPKKQWKPSDEQMNTLEYYMHTLTCNEHKEILFGLYTDLKKLREE